MAQQPAEQKEPSSSDIVFDCPACGKSLAVDRRGAGLTIKCPLCHQAIQVPAAEDAAEPPVEAEDPRDRRILELTEALEIAQGKIQRLVEELEEVRSRRKVLEQMRTEHLARFRAISRELGIMQNALDRIAAVLGEEDLNRESGPSE